MRGEIQKQWSKFTYEEVTALKSKDELVAKVQTKYALDKSAGPKGRRCIRQGSTTLITARRIHQR